MSLKHVILTVLHQRRATGYDIVKDFQDALGFFWSATPQQVYRDLGELTEAGLVRFTTVDQSHKPDKKVYEVTAEGRAELRSWLEAPTREAPVRNAFLVKLLAGALVEPAALRGLIEGQRARHAEQLALFRSIEQENFARQPVGELPLLERVIYMTLRLGIAGEESWLGWADALARVVGEGVDGVSPE